MTLRPGLDHEGCFLREGSLSRVPAAFAPVVEAVRARITAAFGPPGGPRLHSAYLYGSIPRGTAIPGVSDLDLLLAFRQEPSEDDRSAVRALNAEVDAAFPQIDGVGTLAYGVDTLLSELERNDLGWFVSRLCTPLLGDDLSDRLPRYRPTSLLARETNGDLAEFLPRWRARATAPDATEADLLALSRGASRKTVRTGFTLVMPRWNGWTSDLSRSAEVFAQYYPARAAQMHAAARTARTPSPDRAALATLTDDLGPWLATEYTTLHGTKTPRPYPT
ncbi:nucleotidyltransferase domain-containing protein [Streptacidiphilus sp. PB12-B1b]|uniref:nucleotidyltransferase domain-containing protein n=1 Tax=Streptacidiphilus sp. PB12-B1b TaxID=2705012 RepID=UPI0015F8BE29|nr:nucleotidyltransferase domain-containing protein [Streptacidiphilus sp. PB12-B1b]QMU75148.1 nucleotidyltransferase domain-containing protein [Streptacidiphilus sp. PB12-B1b]